MVLSEYVTSRSSCFRAELMPSYIIQNKNHKRKAFSVSVHCRIIQIIRVLPGMQSGLYKCSLNEEINPFIAIPTAANIF